MFLQNILKTVNTYSSQSIQKTAEEGTLSNSFSEASITLISKPNKDIHTQEKKKKTRKEKDKKITGQITDEHRCKNSQQTKFNNTLKGSHTMTK